MDERTIERLMKSDFSVGTDGFRNELLNQCLEAIESDMREIPDSTLELLSAAGAPSTMVNLGSLGNNKLR